MDIPFYSEQAKTINKYIFETIYHAALERSFELSYNRMMPMRKIIEENKKNDIFVHADDVISREYNDIYDEDINDIIRNNSMLIYRQIKIPLSLDYIVLIK